MPEAVFTLADLHRIEWQDQARWAWDNGHTITVLAPEVSEVDRIAVEQWLISHGIVYQKLLLRGQC